MFLYSKRKPWHPTSEPFSPLGSMLFPAREGREGNWVYLLWVSSSKSSLQCSEASRNRVQDSIICDVGFMHRIHTILTISQLKSWWTWTQVFLNNMSIAFLLSAPENKFCSVLHKSVSRLSHSNCCFKEYGGITSLFLQILSFHFSPHSNSQNFWQICPVPCHLRQKVWSP